MIEFIMFDADGVLFDSYESNIAYYDAIFGRLGQPPLDPRERAASVFYSAGQVFEMRAGGDRGLAVEMERIGAEISFTPFFKLFRVPFDLRPFLLELKRRYRIGLATNRSATVPALVDYLKLTGVFDATACAGDNVRPKPAPDILELCIRRARASREHSVYVGDSEFDRQAALSAGTRFIGVGSCVEHPHRVATIGELPGMLETIGGRRPRGSEADAPHRARG